MVSRSDRDANRQAPGALIIDGAQTSLGIIRSLGRQGVRVWLISEHPLARYSRYVERSFDWDGPNNDHRVSRLLDIAGLHNLEGWVLFATGDEGLRLLAENHATLASRFQVASPDREVAKWLLDKRLTYQRAASLAIDHPWTFYPKSLADILSIDCRFPVIIKPSTRRTNNEFTFAKAWKAENRDALVSLYQRAAAVVQAEDIVIQEWIPGNGSNQFSYAGLWKQGEPIASVVARRTRQYPIEFGRSSTFVETIENHSVEEAACRFLKSLDYTGVAELEFKYDDRDQRYKLLDVNGRFWTWNALGAAAGADFAYLAWQIAVGKSALKCRARPGVAWAFGSRDLLAACQAIAAGKLTLLEYLRSFGQPLVFATLAADDPLPAIVEFPLLLWNRIRSHQLRSASPYEGMNAEPAFGDQEEQRRFQHHRN